jgi:integrase
MSLFVLNTAVRDDVVCNLQGDWELPIPELETSVFVIPVEHVKGRRVSKAVICNSVAQGVIERQRGRHPEYVFVMQWHNHPLGPVETMHNTAWQTARVRAGIPDLHVHDLRHTAGMRLREAGVAELTRREILWHSNGSITDHYTMAQVVEFREALEKISKPANNWNRSLQALRAEAAARKASDTARKPADSAAS